MDTLPPLPGLSGDIILEVFTHRSLRFPGAPTAGGDEYGNDRLAAIGEKALEMAITDALFRQRPVLKAVEIEVSQSFLGYHTHAHFGLDWVLGLHSTPHVSAVRVGGRMVMLIYELYEYRI